MRAAVGSIVWRYLGILLQLVLVLAVTRSLPMEMAGRYLAVFGLVAVGAQLSGLGLPDGVMRDLSRRRAEGRDDSGLLRAAMPAILAVNLPLALAAGWAGAALAGLPGSAVPLISVWAFGYAAVFALGQCLVGAGHPARAAFTVYAALGLATLALVGPYILRAAAPGLGPLMARAAAAALTVATVCVALGVASRGDGATAGPLRLWRCAREGAPMMVARVMQAALPWGPVWGLGALGRPEEAAIYAAASRLTVAVTSVTGALRFGLRDEIVARDRGGEPRALVRLTRRSSLLAAGAPLLGLGLVLSAGERVLPALLGAEYLAAVPVLAVLMVAVLAEAVGGLSDEILKMTGRTRIVLLSLATALTLQAVLIVGLAPHGPAAVAWATVVAFAVQYGWQVLWLSLRTPVRILPLGHLAGRSG